MLALRVNRFRVYLACPISLGDQSENFRRADEMMESLTKLGFAVLNPAFSISSKSSLNWQQWIEACLPWVAASDAVFRLPGRSVGADIECHYARTLLVPVFHELIDIKNWQETKRRNAMCFVAKPPVAYISDDMADLIDAVRGVSGIVDNN